MIRKVAIVGAGPAGMTAALQLRRAGIDFVIFERNEPGGLLLNAGCIENYPGLERPVSGLELVKRFREQMAEHGIEISPFAVDRIGYDGRFITGGAVSKYLIIATGTVPKMLSDDIGREVYYHIHGLLSVRNEKIAVIGGGDAAFDYALTFASNDNSVTMFIRGEKASCLPLLYARARKNRKVDIRFGSVFREEGFKYVVAAIGREPCLDVLPERLLREPPPGLYLAGDVKRGKDRQLVIAAADGMLAAQDIIRKEGNC